MRFDPDEFKALDDKRHSLGLKFQAIGEELFHAWLTGAVPFSEQTVTCPSCGKPVHSFVTGEITGYFHQAVPESEQIETKVKSGLESVNVCDIDDNGLRRIDQLLYILRSGVSDAIDAVEPNLDAFEALAALKLGDLDRVPLPPDAAQRLQPILDALSRAREVSERKGTVGREDSADQTGTG